MEFGGKRNQTLRFDKKNGEKNHELKVQKLLEIDEKIQALHFDEKISEKRTQYVLKVKLGTYFLCVRRLTVRLVSFQNTG